MEEDLSSYIFQNYRKDEPYQPTDEERETLQRKHEVFQEITSEFPVSLGKDAPRKERQERVDLEVPDSTLTYGELDFVSIGEVFQTIKKRYAVIPEGGVFYDLGSGTGKGVITGALLHPFEECRGIELLSGLHGISCQVKEKYDAKFPKAVAENPQVWSSVPKVNMILGDMFEVDWTDASFIFANSTCYSHEMMKQIAEKEVPVGTIALSMTKEFPSNKWQVLESVRKQMSWGEGTVYIQRRVPEE